MLKYHTPFIYASSVFPSIDYCREDYITLKKFFFCRSLDNSVPRDGVVKLQLLNQMLINVVF